MTIRQVITLRNFMIILCITMIGLLGQKAVRIADKIQAVQEGDRLYAAGDLIAAEEQYRQAAGNSSLLYMEDRLAQRLDELGPITKIRNALNTLVLTARAQSATKDFTGLLQTYESLISLKAVYMKTGGSYEAHFRQLSADSGLSDDLTVYFQKFKKQFLAELAESKAGGGSGEDSFKWNLLLIPDAFYGETELKQELLAASFQGHDTVRLKAVAASGSFSPLLDNALSMMNAYRSHDYEAPWILKQTEASTKSILNKDLDADNLSAFVQHGISYRAFARSAGLSSSRVLTQIDKSLAQLLKTAGRKSRAGQHAEAIALYEALAPLQDTSAELAATRLAWNIAEPVRLLPGGELPGKYTHITAGTGRYGAQVYVAGTDSSGRLYYAALKDDGSVVTLNGDVLPGYARLRRLVFDDSLALGNNTGVPVVMAEADSEDEQTLYTAYEMKPEGMTLLLSFTADSYELQADGSLLVQGAQLADGTFAPEAIYRHTVSMYEFSELVQEVQEEQEYPLITASELEQRPDEKVSLQGELYVDNNGTTVLSSDGRYIALQGEIGVTGNSVVSGQFQHNYKTVGTDIGEQLVPEFVVESVGSLSLIY
ncbi:hypothetical protein GCM10010912_31550 [Paenibacillus albidus]|uniref:Uncharacterized protein n=1 Tax=Paenibacillus albidus TaxID=2041023 RepID=A0A917CD95_9BACL|nr:hypothetical protein [Paenibacillus albidus]GGF84042.1 hypothetical protein GCM10010912_31550 [Paenibacillus albidus]